MTTKNKSTAIGLSRESATKNIVGQDEFNYGDSKATDLLDVRIDHKLPGNVKYEIYTQLTTAKNLVAINRKTFVPPESQRTMPHLNDKDGAKFIAGVIEGSATFGQVIHCETTPRSVEDCDDIDYTKDDMDYWEKEKLNKKWERSSIDGRNRSYTCDRFMSNKYYIELKSRKGVKQWYNKPEDELKEGERNLDAGDKAAIDNAIVDILVYKFISRRQRAELFLSHNNGKSLTNQQVLNVLPYAIANHVRKFAINSIEHTVDGLGVAKIKKLTKAERDQGIDPRDYKCLVITGEWVSRNEEIITHLMFLHDLKTKFLSLNKGNVREFWDSYETTKNFDNYNVTEFIETLKLSNSVIDLYDVKSSSSISTLVKDFVLFRKMLLNRKVEYSQDVWSSKVIPTFCKLRHDLIKEEGPDDLHFYKIEGRNTKEAYSGIISNQPGHQATHYKRVEILRNRVLVVILNDPEIQHKVERTALTSDPKIRIKVANRDNFKTALGEDISDPLDGRKYHLDHIKSLDNGGLDHIDNLHFLTAEDNLNKGTKDFDVWLEQKQKLNEE